MAVGFKVKFFWYQIGSGDFLYSFFSTVCYNLENSKWGSRFPHIMSELYVGELKIENIDSAISELNCIKTELSKISVDRVIWDIEDLTKKAPWGDNISVTITNLGNYFVTSEGDDLLTLFSNALEKAKALKTSIKLESI
jgi:hypothetical protein